MAKDIDFEISVNEFNNTLKKYAKITSKTWPEILNRKAYEVSRHAIRKTHIADKKEVRDFFKKKNAPRYTPVVIKAYDLKAEDVHFNLEAFAKKLKAYRVRSVGYLRAGWLPSLKGFAKALRIKPEKTKGVVHKGRPKGRFRVARRNTAKPSASMSNRTGYSDKQSDALAEYGRPAFKKAFRAERISMLRYMEKKAKEAKRAAGIR